VSDTRGLPVAAEIHHPSPGDAGAVDLDCPVEFDHLCAAVGPLVTDTGLADERPLASVCVREAVVRIGRDVAVYCPVRQDEVCDPAGRTGTRPVVRAVTALEATTADHRRARRKMHLQGTEVWWKPIFVGDTEQSLLFVLSEPLCVLDVALGGGLRGSSLSPSDVLCQSLCDTCLLTVRWRTPRDWPHTRNCFPCEDSVTDHSPDAAVRSRCPAYRGGPE